MADREASRRAANAADRADRERRTRVDAGNAASAAANASLRSQIAPIVQQAVQQAIQKAATDNKATQDNGVNRLMSANLNRYMMMPLSPAMVLQGTNSPNVVADTIAPFTAGNIIQVEGSININSPYFYEYNGIPIKPDQLTASNVSIVLDPAGTGSMKVEFGTDPQLTMTDGEAVFQYADGGTHEYNVVIDGHLTTSNSVGINQAPVPGKALSILGDVLVNGAVSFGGVSLANLAIGQPSVEPPYVLDVSGGPSILRQSLTVAQNSYVQGNLGIGKTTAAAPLDVLGSALISNNLTVSNSTFTQSAGIGKVTVTPGLALDV